MNSLRISFMERNNIQESARVLSAAMLDNPLHGAVFRGKGESERLEIEKMFFELFNELPGIVFLAKEEQNIIGVMRMKSCQGRKAPEAVTPGINWTHAFMSCGPCPKLSVFGIYSFRLPEIVPWCRCGLKRKERSDWSFSPHRRLAALWVVKEI